MAATRANLRAIKSPGQRSKRQPQSVAEAARGGSHRDLLVSMRERIAATVSSPDCPPRDLASLTRRLQDIAKEIDTIDLRAKQEAAQDCADDEIWDEKTL